MSDGFAQAGSAGLEAPEPTPICAIGASAGGVQALRELFQELPDDLGLAYVIIIHLAPDHPSALSEILGGVTRMPVRQALLSGTDRLSPDCVYVIPPDRELVIKGDELQARPFTEPRGQRAPIDMFFRSVATARGDGLAIVLTGTGSDRAMGVRSIKEAGGVIFVQEPSDAEYPMMPQSALATGVADFVAPIPRLVERIIEVSRSKHAVRSLDTNEAANDLRRIVGFLRARTGHDFSSYKRATVLRRVKRRMQVTRRNSLADYATHLVENPEEAQELFGDLLISLTQFFRDPEAYRILAEQAIGPLFNDAGERGLRAWVVGCATGEEAYSLAILMLEEAERRRVTIPIQIFATDLDEGALATGREARYPASIEADVSEERLKRWFVSEGSHFRIKKEVRDCVLFANHSVLKDPPFMHMDLVSCRNLLIYMERDLQRQVAMLFHYGLEPNGFLFLGSAETVEASPEIFYPVHREARLYRARPTPRRSLPILTNLPQGHHLGLNEPQLRRTEPERRREIGDRGAASIHLSALEQSSPPSALVDHDHRIIHLSPRAGQYLLPGGGAFTNDIGALIRPELRLDVRGALRRALEHGDPSVTPPLLVAFSGERRRILLYVAPVRNEDDSPPHRALLWFLDGGPASASEQAEATALGADEVRRLREQVRSLEERLLTSRNEHESAIQELRVANEELQSINEEYRSTSEELETSKEELQSMNEELQTVNAELKVKLDSISTAHSDLQNLIASTEIGTLFLDSDLRIRLFTPMISQLFNVTEADTGRRITNFTHRLEHSGIEEEARAVLRDLKPVEQEISTKDGRFLMMRVRPYRTIDDRIGGVVITFVDISELREAVAGTRRAVERLTALVEASSEFVYSMSADWSEMRSLSGGGVIADVGQPSEDWVSRFILPEDQPGVWERIREAIRTKSTFELEHRIRRADGSVGWVQSRAAPLLDEQGQISEWFGAATEVTERHRQEEERELLTRELSHRVKNTLAVVHALARQTGGATVEEFREAFGGRLDALAKAHTMLLESDWRSADLSALASQALSAYGTGEEGRVRLDGPHVTVSARQALSLSLVLHELATNALKYGALSVKDGHVRLTWTAEDRPDAAGTLRLEWIEQGGPAVTPPTSGGFGAQLIQRAVEYELGGAVELIYAPGGLTCKIALPRDENVT